MNSSVVATIPFTPFISFSIARLNQLSKKVNIESLESIFEDIYYENTSKRNIPVYVNNQKVMNIDLETDLNIAHIEIIIDNHIKEDIMKFKRYLEQIKTIKENPAIVEALKDASNGISIKVTINKQNDTYTIAYYAIIDGRSIAAGVINVATKEIEQAKIDDVEILDNMFKKSVDVTDDPEKKASRSNHKLSKIFDEILELYDNLLVVAKKYEDILNERFQQLTGQDIIVDDINEEAEQIIKRARNANDIVAKYHLLRNLENVLKAYSSVGYDIEEIKAIIRKIVKRYWVAAAVAFRTEFLDRIVKGIIMLFVKPFIFIAQGVKKAVTAFLNMIKKFIQNRKKNNQLPESGVGEVQTNAKIYANYIARFEYYSIVYENSILGKISSIISNMFRILKNVVTKGIKAIKDFTKWLISKATDILHVLIKGSLNILTKIDAKVEAFKNRFNKSNT